MVFKRIDPPDPIRAFIECYWVIEDEGPIPVQQKIVPDGFPEIIFHYGDPYKILIANEWELQADFLLAGQITKFFFLENIGKTGVFGIKFKPADVYQLFNFSMEEYNDKVVSLNNTKNSHLKRIKQILSLCPHEERISQLNSLFETLIQTNQLTPGPIGYAIDLINEKKGMITVSKLSNTSFLSERQLLNQFRQQVGLSPKLYARIIRLNYIFQLVMDKKEKWSSLAYEAAYFDQAHFIRDFKTFTGDNPGQYAFDEKNFANFFLMRDKNN
jgi:AraC-like DNA-binding protein